MSKNPHFLIHDHQDNVGVVVVEDLAAGTNMLGVITEDDSTTKCKAKDSIPIGHKVALTNLKKGDTVIKYGVDIGIMTADAKKGEHVHVHHRRGLPLRLGGSSLPLLRRREFRRDGARRGYVATGHRAQTYYALTHVS